MFLKQDEEQSACQTCAITSPMLRAVRHFIIQSYSTTQNQRFWTLFLLSCLFFLYISVKLVPQRLLQNGFGLTILSIISWYKSTQFLQTTSTKGHSKQLLTNYDKFQASVQTPCNRSERFSVFDSKFHPSTHKSVLFSHKLQKPHICGGCAVTGREAKQQSKEIPDGHRSSVNHRQHR